MNWVGGSRSRLILRQERRKQKEYFEKKKLESKMNLLGLSSPKTSAVSLDLLNLYVVNQISTKKEKTENTRKPVHVDITRDAKIPVRRHNLELPMSPPRTQHKSNLDDLQNRLQKQVLDSRRQHLLEKVKYQHNLSQVTESACVDSSVEYEDNVARTFSSCPLSSSGFWPSNCTQPSEENFNMNLMGNISEQTYEGKMQNQPRKGFGQDPWNTKPPSQCIYRKSDKVPQELFEPLHRLAPMNSARKNPVIMTSSESENCEGIKEQIFDVVKETAKPKVPQDGSSCCFLSLFGDESQPIHNNSSTKHFNPFVDQNSTDIFFSVPNVVNQMTNKNYPYDTGEAYSAINSKRSSVDRHLEGIFTAPEQIFLKSDSAASASYKGTSGLNKTHLQFCHEGQHYFRTPEQKEKPANLGKIDTFAYHHDQQINLKENVQNYPRKNSDDNSVRETGWRQNQLFGLEETICCHSTCGQREGSQQDVEPPLSSESHSYSPRQAESSLSSIPDTSEEKDTAKRKEYLSEQSLKTRDANQFSASASTAATKSSHTRTVPPQPSSSSAREEANHLQEKDSPFCATEDENKTHTAPSEGSSSQQAVKREDVTLSTRREVWSQTECSVTEVEKADVATQCVTMRVCGCGGSLPPACSPGRVPPPSAAGGHKPPAPESLQPAGTGSAVIFF
ncbi:PREDICTED: uncharacterized protein C12orf40 homolog [Acanthisitta chloris]|uniref:uncharacterized protein C12orf40 homolog n=1 Tax=Acanthisitta chloris TaxID=57068 RepID=UPI0004F0F533|nr:PREDICTED: uncharacterized protein C12orf40 homolog [Acanthisitta chloris]